MAGMGALAALLAGLLGACGGDDEPVTAGTAGMAGKGGSGGKGGTAGTGGSGGTGGAGGTTDASAGSAGTGGGGRGGGGSGGGGTAGTGGGGTGGGGTGGGGTGGASGSAGSRPDGGGTGGGTTEAGPDGDGSVQPDASDAADAGPPITIDQYLRLIDIAWCRRIGECCNLGGRLDIDKCVNIADSNFGADNLGAYLGRYGGNFTGVHAVFNMALARDCIDQQRNRTCMDEGSDVRRARYATCMTAVQGTLTMGMTGCKTSMECTAGLFCSLPGDGGLGTCTAVAGSGGMCRDPYSNSDECTYLGLTSATSRHCDVNSMTPTNTCLAGLPNGMTCFTDQECASSVCSTLSGNCVASEAQFPSQFLCNLFTVPSDSGGGG
jgi:hypothetical protein